MLRELYLIHLRLLHTVPSPKLRNDCGEFNTAVHIAFLLPLVIFLSLRRRRDDAPIEVGVVAFPLQNPVYVDILVQVYYHAGAATEAAIEL